MSLVKETYDGTTNTFTITIPFAPEGILEAYKLFNKLKRESETKSDETLIAFIESLPTSFEIKATQFRMQYNMIYYRSLGDTEFGKLLAVNVLTDYGITKIRKHDGYYYVRNRNMKKKHCIRDASVGTKNLNQVPVSKLSPTPEVSQSQTYPTPISIPTPPISQIRTYPTPIPIPTPPASQIRTYPTPTITTIVPPVPTPTITPKVMPLISVSRKNTNIPIYNLPPVPAMEDPLGLLNLGPPTPTGRTLNLSIVK